jgi:soluble lytic murein transglycosylase
MKKLIIASFFLFLSAAANALTVAQSKLFLSYLKNGEVCSEEFLNNFKNTPLKRAATLLYLSKCLEEGRFKGKAEGSSLRTPYGKLLLAEYLYLKGERKEALKLFKQVFSSTESFDAEIFLTLKPEDRKELFSPALLRNKVWRLAARREFDEANFYLSYLKGDRLYFYLTAYLLFKEGKRKQALALFQEVAPNVPRSYLFLTYLSRSLPEKFYYYRLFLKKGKSPAAKRRLTVYLMDYFFRKDLGYYKELLNLIKNRFPDLYYEGWGRYYLFSGDCGKLPKRRGLPFSAWRAACSGRKLSLKGINFYSLLLSPPARFPYRKREVFKDRFNDPGLKYLVDERACLVVSFIDERSPQNALAQYYCKNYKKGIKVAAKFKGELKRYPYLLKVLYPAPDYFKGDLYSLAIARQESLFDPLAYSRSGAIGVMQIMPRTGAYIAKKVGHAGYAPEQLFDPKLNYRFGSYYLHSLMKRFKLFPLAAAAYNGGPGRVSRALKLFGPVRTPQDLIVFTDAYLPFAETRDYVRRTFVNLYYYSNLYGTGKEWKIFSKRSRKRVTRKTR